MFLSRADANERPPAWFGIGWGSSAIEEARQCLAASTRSFVARHALDSRDLHHESFRLVGKCPALGPRAFGTTPGAGTLSKQEK